jgi:hypothetical protein
VSGSDKGWKGGRIFRINVMYEGAHVQFAERHGVVVAPTFILLDKSGTEVRRWVGEEPHVGELP